ncbi:YkuJ family protein [Liquorilactobacillus nagelii]|uniref:YkuJ family protein n=1 Tax=Liquorilactobacillus nagelii TaxID=82688 RepID=UPI0039ED6E6E
MEKSQLAGIISRLEAMVAEDNPAQEQQRRFEKNGQERGVVTYDKESATFILEELPDKQRFEFDNVDLAAIDIYELLND